MIMEEKISSGCKELDSFLSGGYDNNIITTIYGPAGSGKSNLCLIAAANMARAGRSVLYIDTESNFSVERLKQIAPDYEKILENILILKPTTFDGQKKLFADLPSTINKEIGLIIVDTLVTLYRISRTKKESYDVIKDLEQQITALNEITRRNRIPVIITSQVYSMMNGTEEVGMVGGDLIKYVSKCIIELQNLKSFHRFKIKKHRSLPLKELNFKIIEEGIEIIKIC